MLLNFNVYMYHELRSLAAPTVKNLYLTAFPHRQRVSFDALERKMFYNFHWKSKIFHSEIISQV
jgi:hypothetical protein